MISAPNSIFVELHVPDFKIAKDFYQKLGFQVVWERTPHEKKGYLVMKRDNNIICFWPGNEYVRQQSYFKRFPQDTKRGFGVEIVVMIDDIDAFYESIKDFANIITPLQVKHWGLKDFRIEDPFGFYVRFSEPHNILDRGNTVT